MHHKYLGMVIIIFLGIIFSFIFSHFSMGEILAFLKPEVIKFY